MIIQWNRKKLNKYLSRIDGAIVQGRYSLALKLANRLLKHYYRFFIVFKMPTESEKDNINTMSLSISKYLLKYYRKSKIPYSERRLMKLALTANVLDAYTPRTLESNDDKVIDEETATYVRENVNSVIQFLMKY